MKTVGNLITQTTLDDLSERIQVMYREKSRNSRGDIILSEPKIRCRCWAKILPYQAHNENGSEVELKNSVFCRLAVRWRDDIKPDDIIYYGSKKLRLRAPPYDAESRHIFTILECEEVVGDGE